MRNIIQKVTGNTLTISVDISKTCGASKTGKSIIIASTKGSVQVDGHPEIVMSINIYCPL